MGPLFNLSKVRYNFKIFLKPNNDEGNKKQNIAGIIGRQNLTRISLI